MIHVTIKLLGPFRFLAGVSGADGACMVELASGSCLGDALLRAELPADAPRIVLLNGIQRSDDPELAEGDIITVFPPIAGGAPAKAWIH